MPKLSSRSRKLVLLYWNTLVIFIWPVSGGGTHCCDWNFSPVSRHFPILQAVHIWRSLTFWRFRLCLFGLGIVLLERWPVHRHTGPVPLLPIGQVGFGVNWSYALFQCFINAFQLWRVARINWFMIGSPDSLKIWPLTDSIMKKYWPWQIPADAFQSPVTCGKRPSSNPCKRSCIDF